MPFWLNPNPSVKEITKCLLLLIIYSIANKAIFELSYVGHCLKVGIMQSHALICYSFFILMQIKLSQERFVLGLRESESCWNSEHGLFAD